MHLDKTFMLPIELQPIQSLIQSSISKTIILTPMPIQPTIIQSKLAGIPYLPKNEHPATGIQGQPMLLLAQLNFSELPKLENFPTEGILQFFIAQSCYEDYTVEHAKSLFTIRYYPTITPYCDTPTNYLKDANFIHFPIQSEQALLFHSQLEPVSATDYRLSHYVNPTFLAQPFTTGEPTLSDLYFQYYLSADHKIGGYPYFIYEDIRIQNPSFNTYDTLLFQLISNDAQSIMWGDAGVISFFINKEKLKQRDFSDVLFYAEDY